MQCPSCSCENDEASKFCVQCGKSLLPTVRGDSDKTKILATGKNPVIALVLSLLIPGVGQFYNGDVKKGAVMLGCFLVGIPLSGGVVSFGVWIWSMIDAYNVGSRKWPIW